MDRVGGWWWPGRQEGSPPAGHAAVRATAARRIAAYGSFTLVEAQGTDVDALIAAGGEKRDDMREVRIGRTTSDPRTARPALVTKAATRQAPKPGLAVVQFVGPIKDAWRAALVDQGVHIVTYMAQNAYLVHGDSAAMGRLEAFSGEPYVRAITPYRTADKLAAGLASAGSETVTVETVAGADGASARSRLTSAGASIGDPVRIGDLVARRYRLPAADVGPLAADPGVVAVEPFVAPRPLDERAAQIVAGNLSSTFQPVHGHGYKSFLKSLGITSSATTVDINDTGVDKGVVPVPAGSHPDFYKGGKPSNPSRIQYAHNGTTDTDARDCRGHGTNVATIATGYDSHNDPAHEDAQGFQYGLGIDPFAKLGATKVFNCAGAWDLQTSLTALADAAYASGARVSNHSWGADLNGAYTTQSQEEDAIVRDARPGVSGNQQLTEVFSAGNKGPGPNTLGAPATAKNVLTVGASENVRPIGGSDGCGVPDTASDSARDVASFSSRGPTDDGRLKPDVVAPGTHVTGAQPQVGGDYTGKGACNPLFPAGSTLYNLVSGTSQAAPEVTGLASLVRTWFDHTYRAFPSPAMTKALIANGATDLSGGDDGAGGTLGHAPSQVQGWGRANLPNIVGSVAVPPRVYDQKTRLDHTGDASTKQFHVALASKRLRVTLAWTDPPGPTTGDAFVNDLDLEVTAGGRTYRGNALSGGVSVVNGAADPRNNLETVILPAGISGPVTVKVIGRNIAGDGVPGNADPTDQDFALVVTNVSPAITWNLQHAGYDAFDSAGGDGDGIAEPGETVRLRERLRNVGDAPTPGLSGTLSDGTQHVAVTDPGPKSWPHLTPGATGSNPSPFSVKLGSLVPCGAPVSLTAHVTTSGETYTLPFTLPTGSPSDPVIARSPHVPAAIPDNDPAGVTSTEDVTAPGRIKDVDVGIDSIAHTWDGDLKIEIIAPNGQDVVLADRPGGPDNAGDNFTSTVFDDSAAQSISQGTAPYTGTFRPQLDQLARLDGGPAQGTWTLKVADLSPGDTGEVDGWGTTVRGSVCG